MSKRREFIRPTIKKEPDGTDGRHDNTDYDGDGWSTGERHRSSAWRPVTGQPTYVCSQTVDDQFSLTER